MAKIFEFTAQERAEVFKAIQESFGSDDAFVNRYIDNLENTGKVYSFGYGSLMKNPHTDQVVVKYPARVEGMVMRVNCAFRFYGGTHDYPALMVGMEKDKNGMTPGEITELSFVDENNKPKIAEIVKFFKGYRERENPPGQPIYAYDQDAFVEVIPEGKTEPVVALACVANTKGPLFIGADGENLTLDEKAMLIVNEYGAQLGQRYSDGSLIWDGDPETEATGGVSARCPHQKTIYSYIIETIDARYKRGMPVEPELKQLVEKMNYYRAQMDPHKRLFLETLESGVGDQSPEDAKREMQAASGKENSVSSIFRIIQQQRRDLDERVFEAQNGPDLTREEYEEKLFTARNKLRKALGMPLLEPGARKPMLHEEDILKGVQDPSKTIPEMHNQ